MSLLEMHGLWKNYRRGGFFRRQPPLSVLRDAGLRIVAGECVALLGASGSGKSTLGRLLLGLETPDAGEVLFEGQPLLDTRGRMRAQTRRSIQAVFQDPHGATSPRFSAFEVVAEPLRYAGLRGAPLRARVEGLAASVGLDPSELGRLAHRFSGGQLQRLCIARALAPSPRLLLLDEAVSSLDLETQAQILNLLSGLRASAGVAFLFITHDLRLVRGFAQRCYVMQDGQPVEVAEPFGQGPVPPALGALRAAILPARPRGVGPQLVEPEVRFRALSASLSMTRRCC
ncbi:ATP-binding cassette domain-containing protein [Pseudoroseomonas wenyumeiae]|uniref:ATP-binding cassette domain-containing protein n=1 Tax=Teichococcus wenyumeiae TaxID=2478470 RepID=A0A3A9JGK8_9PROT|nr:ATP-binding cassette domain-containing protein [Pseudoroseomonas wenyumeiae]RKK02776.1 ATP-binding cassette domain-containing protein [Pseudoroseomonas wenyumeiae]RMI15434.1 ATP-binding cassette domain-containing protein [Pseudoroseomonas wenyumeiae]